MVNAAPKNAESMNVTPNKALGSCALVLVVLAGFAGLGAETDADSGAAGAASASRADAEGRSRDGTGPCGNPEFDHVLLDETPRKCAILRTKDSTFSSLICPGGECVHRLSPQDSLGAVETMVVIDAADPDRVLASALAGSRDDPQCALLAEAFASSDGGRSWTSGHPFAPGNAQGLIGDCTSDPLVAFDGLGNGFSLPMSVVVPAQSTGGALTPRPESVPVFRTTDDGASWDEVALAYVGFNDKNWAATDPSLNRIYLAVGGGCPSSYAMTHSDDSGQTWSAPTCLPPRLTAVQIEVGPDGTLYAAARVEGRDPWNDVITTSGHVAFLKSRDGGVTWSEPVVVAPYRGIPTGNPVGGGHIYRSFPNPDIAVAYGTGAVYLAWHDTFEGQQSILFAASRDGGATWTEPVVVEDAAAFPADQFIPAVAASPDGDAHVIFFDTRHDLTGAVNLPTADGHRYDIYYAHSADGVTFDANIRLTPTSSTTLGMRTGVAASVGDYLGIAATNTEAVAAFPWGASGVPVIYAAILGG